jgi:hypothetical protein
MLLKNGIVSDTKRATLTAAVPAVRNESLGAGGGGLLGTIKRTTML